MKELKEKTRRYKLKNRLFVSIAALVFLSVMLVSAIGSYRLSGQIVEQNTSQTRQLIDQLALNTGSYISELSRLCMSPYYSEQVMKLLDTEPDSAAERLEKQRGVENYLREVMTIPRKDILCVNILTDAAYSSSRTGHAPNYASRFASEEWYKDSLDSASAVFIPAHTESYGSYSATVFSMVLRLQSLSDSKKTLGVIRVDANYSGLKDVLDDVDVPEKGALYIFDSTGSIIYRRSDLPGNISDSDVFPAVAGSEENTELFGEKYRLCSRNISGTDWTISAVNAESVLMQNVRTARRTTTLLALLCAAVALVVTALFVRSIIEPLNETINTMRAAEQGDLSVRAPDSRAEEVAYLNRSFNEMLRTISETMEHNTRLTREMYEAKYLRKKAQYDALCNQIRPHFLFNNLSTVSLLVKSGRNDDAVKTIDELAILLRGMVNTDKEIPLSAELKIAASYLSLQERRHDFLRYTVTADEAVQSCLIPALTVQPIVENALIHGCEPSRGNMRIDITAKAEGGDVVITVRDNGVGIGSERLAELNRAVTAGGDEANTTAGGGVGLSNIAQRLHLRFGERSAVSIESKPGKGTAVTVRFPQTKEEANTEHE